MNYIELINNFWRLHEEHPFGTVAGMMYFHLLDVSNKQNWRNPFKRQNTRICGDLGITNPTLIKARNELKQRGLIEFYTKGKGDSNVKYEINNVKYFHTPFHTSFNSPFTSSYDLSKTDTNTKTETKEVNVITTERQNEFDNAIADFINPDPESPIEKEKSCGQKEKDFPPLEVARDNVTSTASWRNILSHYKMSEEDREQLFKIFYEQNEDKFRIRYPTFIDMAQHFYYWIDTRNQKQATRTNTNNQSKFKKNAPNQTVPASKFGKL